MGQLGCNSELLMSIFSFRINFDSAVFPDVGEDALNNLSDTFDLVMPFGQFLQVSCLSTQTVLVALFLSLQIFYFFFKGSHLFLLLFVFAPQYSFFFFELLLHYLDLLPELLFYQGACLDLSLKLLIHRCLFLEPRVQLRDVLLHPIHVLNETFNLSVDCAELLPQGLLSHGTLFFLAFSKQFWVFPCLPPELIDKFLLL